MNFIRFWQVSAILFLAAFIGCTQQQQSPEAVRERTAQVTAAAKSNAKAIAQGIREGWNRNKPLDLNSATKDDLVSLPGVTTAKADRVIAGRPYKDPGELVTRRILSKAEYDKISDRIAAK